MTDNSVSVNGTEYKVGDNMRSSFYPELYKNETVCFYTYANRIVGISKMIQEDGDYYRIKEYSQKDNRITIVNRYTNPTDYYISPNGNITEQVISDMENANISFMRDEYKNIYSISKKSEVEISHYKTVKPSTWDDVQSSAQAFITACTEYQNGVIAALNKEDDEENKKTAIKREGAKKLLENDGKSNSKMLSFAAMPEEDKIYAYEALYDAMGKIGDQGIDLGKIGDQGIDLGKIDMSKDIITVSTNIVKDIMGGIYPNNFSGRYGDYTIDVNMFVMNFSDLKVNVSADLGSMICKKGGRTIDTVAICSTQEQPAEAVSVYANQLKQLENNALKAAVNAVIKELAGDSINKWGSNKLKKIIHKYETQLNVKGVGDLGEVIADCGELYKQIKKIIKAANASPEKQYEAIIKIDYLATIKEDKSITDRTVATLFKKLKAAANTLESNINSYKNNTKIEKKSLWNFISSIQCPVDVYVYNNIGEEVGHIIGNDIECSDDIALEKLGDIKKVYLPNMSDYSIKVIATDNGKFNYTIEEYRDSLPVGRANFYDIKMQESDEFDTVGNITDLSAEFENIGLIKNNDSSFQISPNEYISSEDNANVIIYGSVEGNGEIMGLGSYAKGDGVNLTAVPDEYNTFAGWYIDGELVSEDMIYSLSAVDDILVTAKFKENFEILVRNAKYSDTGLKADVDIKNNTNEIFGGKAYIGIYDINGKLIGIDAEPVTISSNDGFEFRTEICSRIGKDDRIKLFLWDDDLCPAILPFETEAVSDTGLSEKDIELSVKNTEISDIGLKADINIKNNTNEAFWGNTYIGVYDINDNLKGVELESVIIESNYELEFKIEIHRQIRKDDKIKLFLWNKDLCPVILPTEINR